MKPKILLRQTEMAAFAQDDWRISSRLTLSLGLRYELFLNPYEDRNRLAMFDINTGAIVVATDNGKLPSISICRRLSPSWPTPMAISSFQC